VFSTKTMVRFSAGKAATARVLVFDAEGRRVRTLVNGSVRVGNGAATWDGRGDRGMRVPAGVYMVVLETGEERAKAKVVMSE
jgi:flagellar hook assembly protein FlgD